jgi:hypothetical protein
VIIQIGRGIVFKSPLDSYNCASPKIPITLSATPVGGVWSGGSYVNGNKLSPAGLNGTMCRSYILISNQSITAKLSEHKEVKFKCTSGISGLDNYDDFTVYPMPFSDKITSSIPAIRQKKPVCIFTTYLVEKFITTAIDYCQERI